MEINLFDLNGVNKSPVPGKDFSSKNITFVNQLMKYDGISIFTDKHILKGSVNGVKSKLKIAWLWEPKVVHPQLYRALKATHHKYDYILTHDDEVLKLSDKCICVPTGMTWIPDENRQIFKKSKKVSTIVSKKKYLKGHKLRHELCKVEGVQKFGNSVKYIKDKTDALRDFRYSVTVENCSINNYFTEKLIDCFVTGTIPVYWGCANIGKYFNMGGIIMVNNLKDLKKKIASFTDERYNSALPAIKDNYNRALEYTNMFDWAYKNILKDLDK